MNYAMNSKVRIRSGLRRFKGYSIYTVSHLGRAASEYPDNRSLWAALAAQLTRHEYRSYADAIAGRVALLRTDLYEVVDDVVIAYGDDRGEWEEFVSRPWEECDDRE